VCFGQSLRPSSGVQDCTYSNRYMSDRYCYLLASKQITVSDDGRKDRPKHMECLSKINKLEKLVHLVGFTIEIYYDAWLYESQPCIIICII
jgi:hypothetical protein